MKTPKRIMDAARGEACTLNIVGFCTYESETTVAAHLPDGSGGSNRYTGPLSIAFACRDCHSVIDNRVITPVTREDREFYMRRGMMRTINRLIDIGLVKL